MTIRTPRSPAQSNAAATSAELPAPSSSSTRSGIIDAARGDADHAGAVLGRGDGARDVGAVAVPVLRVGVVVDEVVAGQTLGDQIGVPEVDAGVGDGDRQPGAARVGPGLGGVDVGVDGPAPPPDGLAGVVEAPQQPAERLGGEAAGGWPPPTPRRGRRAAP